MPTPVLLSLLCAAAFSPALAIAGGLTAAAAVAGVTAFASLPGGVLVELLVGALERVQEGGKKGAASAEDLEREISEAIQRALSTGSGASTELRAEIAEVLKKIDVGGEVLRVALDESDERVRQDISAAVGFLGSHFDELRFLVQDIEEAVVAIQASLDLQSADVRAIMGQNDRQSTDIRLIRESLAVILRRTDGAGASRSDETTGPRWVHGCPYRGLLPFEETDAEVFYGRERLTAQLAVHMSGRVRAGGLTVVTGASGAGKSSLLRAGLLPALAAGQQIAGSEYWPRIVMTAGNDPLGDLAAHFAALGGGGDAVTIRNGLEQDPSAAHLMVWSTVLGDAARRPPSGRPGATARLVLVVDQFEQVFTLQPGAGGETGRQAFITALCAAGTKPVGPRAGTRRGRGHRGAR
jgi:hypothetical protein